MPNVCSAAHDKEADDNFQKNREELLRGDEGNDRENGSKNDRKKKRKRSAWRLSDEKEDQAGSESQDRTNSAAKKSGLCRRAHGSNENKISDGWRGGAWLRVEGGIS